MKNTLFLIFLNFMSLNVQAIVQEESFKTTASEFEKFILPLGKAVIPNYKKTIKLHRDKLDFGAFETEPMQVNIGLLNSRDMTVDAVTLIMCHEIGHDLKIARYYTPAGLKYAFSHLEQDYFATFACIMPFFKNAHLETRMGRKTQEFNSIPLGLQTRCSTHFRDHKDVTNCLRSVDASLIAIVSIYDEILKVQYQQSNLPKPALDREWLGPADTLQARLETFVNGIFGDLPFDG